jgi:hypothetical protein
VVTDARADSQGCPVPRSSPEVRLQSRRTLLDPFQVVYDRKNNVERINIKGLTIPPGVNTVTVTVTANSLTGDGINPDSNSTFQQDFALAVENAHFPSHLQN